MNLSELFPKLKAGSEVKLNAVARAVLREFPTLVVDSPRKGVSRFKLPAEESDLVNVEVTSLSELDTSSCFCVTGNSERFEVVYDQPVERAFKDAGIVYRALVSAMHFLTTFKRSKAQKFRYLNQIETYCENDQYKEYFEREFIFFVISILLGRVQDSRSSNIINSTKIAFLSMFMKTEIDPSVLNYEAIDLMTDSVVDAIIISDPDMVYDPEQVSKVTLTQKIDAELDLSGMSRFDEDEDEDGDDDDDEDEDFEGEELEDEDEDEDEDDEDYTEIELEIEAASAAMHYSLKEKYKKGRKADRQTACISEFFGNEEFWKLAFNIDSTNADNNMLMLESYLGSYRTECRVGRMIQSWMRDGF